MAIASSRRLTSDEIRELLALELDDITLDLAADYFACRLGEKKPRFNTYDKFTLLKGQYFNEENIETTIGKYLTNLVVFPDVYLKKYGYVNETLTKSAIGKIEERMANMILNDEMSTKTYSEYLDRGEWWAMGTIYFICPTMDYDINVPIPEVVAKRDELFVKYAEGVAKGDSNVAAKIEKEVLDLAKQKIKEKGNESFDYFESGVGAFGNHYKKTSVMAGAIENPYTHKLDIMKSNYMDGIDIHEYPKFTNLTVIGGYSRGVETQTSGYETKKINNAMQVVVLDDKDSDCGTHHYLKTTVRKSMAKMFLYRYVLTNGKEVLITDDNLSEFEGKEVLLRSPLFCKGDKICNKCAGELFYKLGVKNAGLLNSTMSGTLMNLSMKKFHDSSVKFNKLDVEKYIKER